MRFTLRHGFAATLFLCLPEGPARAQGFLWELDGDAANSSFGYRVANVGDLDGDGAEDFIVVDSYYHQNGKGAVGAFFLYSGRSRTLQWSVIGTANSAYYGEGATSLRDVDGDGYRDFAIGAENSQVDVYSPKTQSLLYSVSGNGSYGIGYSLADAGDVDLDGASDLLVGGYGNHASLFSGKTGALLNDWANVGGQSVDSAGDIDSDGYPDLLIGFPQAWVGSYAFCGMVQIFSGKDFSLLLEVDPVKLGLALGGEPRLGACVRGGHDLDGDGIPDFLAANSGDFSNNNVFAISGATGQVITSWISDGLGKDRSLVFDSDFDRDGVTDIVYPFNGETHVVSGRTRSDLYVLSEGDDSLASSDVNGDGTTDILAGVVPAGTTGAVRAYAGETAPAITSVQPTRANYRAAPGLTITGTALSQGINQKVTVGTEIATNLTIVDDATITCSVLPGAPGIYDVTLQNSLGSSTLPASFVRTPAVVLSGGSSLGASVTLRYLLDPHDGILGIVGFPPAVSIPTPPFDGTLEIAPFTLLFVLPPGLWQGDEFDIGGTIPNDPSLVGVQVLFQALIGPDFASHQKDASWTNCAVLSIG